MAKNILQENSLPPKINGTYRGNFDIIITGIDWKNPSNCCYNTLDCTAKWWGNTVGKTITINSRCPANIPKPRNFYYTINTSVDLFKSYLSNCEPIEIKLSANPLHGYCYIPIPPHFVGAGNNLFCNVQRNILTENKVIIGKIHIKMTLVYKISEVNLSNSSIVDKKHPYFNPLPTNQMSLSNRSFKELDKSSQLDVVNYLAGHKMSEEQQSKTLSEICSISPPESLMGLINNVEPSHPNGMVHINIKSIIMTKYGLTIMKPTILHYFVINLHVGNRNLIPFVANTNVNTTSKVFVLNFFQCITLNSDLSPNHIYNFRVYYCLRRGLKHKSTFLGETSIKFDELLENKTKVLQKECPIMCNDNKILIGTLNVEFKYSNNKNSVYESSDYNKENYNTVNVSNNKQTKVNDAISTHRQSLPLQQPQSASSSQRKSLPLQPQQSPLSYNYKKTETPNPNTCNRDKQVENVDNNKQLALSSNTLQFNQNKQLDNNNITNKNFDQNSVKVMMQQTPDNYITLLQGLIFIGDIENVTPHESNTHFIVCRSFWADVICTNITQNNSFNYLDIFSILCNKEFLERTKNNFLILELWQKSINTTEKLIGIVKLPLHKFYIAFSDPTIIEHLKQSKYPIVSIDGWQMVNAPLTNEPSGLLQLIFAIGTDAQIQFLKLSRNLEQQKIITNNDNNLFLSSMPNIKISNNIMNNENDELLSSNDIEIKTKSSLPSVNRNNTDNKYHKFTAADKLNAFIDSLSQLRAENVSEQKNDGDSSKIMQGGGSPQIRKTSDLLDMLHKALSPPCVKQQQQQQQQQTSQIKSSTLPTSFNSPSSTAPSTSSSTTSSSPINQNININESNLFKAMIEIENALYLPKSEIRFNKKTNKRGKGKNNRSSVDVEPSSYVTFLCYGSNVGTIKSEDGPVYATNIVEKCCSPQWKKKFEVLLPVEMLTNSQLKLKFKVLTKQYTDIPQCRLIPTSDDIIIGLVNIDLTVLTSGLPLISGWFNILDYADHCNGQIKINITPLQNLSRFREESNLRFQAILDDPIKNNNKTTPSDTNCSDLSSTFLSRALKRKFTELEEITERLKTRLQDVTDDDVQCNMELEDEFEKDLNTEVTTDDDDDDENNKISEQTTAAPFGWLKTDQFINKACEFQIKNTQTKSGSTFYNTKPQYTYANEDNNKMTDHNSDDDIQLNVVEDKKENVKRSITGYNQSMTSKHLMDILKNIDLDTIINPNILKKIIDPTVVSSSDENNTYRDLNCTVEQKLFSTSSSSPSSPTSSSSSSEYRVKIISDALQNTVLSDMNEEEIRDNVTTENIEKKCD